MDDFSHHESLNMPSLPKISCDPVLGERLSVCLYLLILALFSIAGCGKGPRLNAKDSPAIEALKPYNPSYELDNQGRVIDLKLEGNGVDNEALEHVTGLTALRKLSLYSAAITDEGLAKLTQNRQLEALGLQGTRVTDEGFTHLEKMPSLQWVWVSKNEKITTKRIDELKKTLPGLTVYHQ